MADNLSFHLWAAVCAAEYVHEMHASARIDMTALSEDCMKNARREADVALFAWKKCLDQDRIDEGKAKK